MDLIFSLLSFLQFLKNMFNICLKFCEYQTMVIIVYKIKIVTNTSCIQWK